MKYLNFRSYIPPACALWTVRCSGLWTGGVLTIRVTLRDTGKPMQSNISDFLVISTTLDKKDPNLRSYITLACALWPGGYLGWWTKVVLTIQVTFRDTGRPMQGNIPDCQVNSTVLDKTDLNFQSYIHPACALWAGGYLGWWTEVVLTIFRNTGKPMQSNILDFLVISTVLDMKYWNFRTYIPPACVLWPGSYLGW